MQFRVLKDAEKQDCREQVHLAERGNWFQPKLKEVDLGPNIKVLPMLPVMRYKYTCWKCGCHTVHHPGIGDWLEGWELVICAGCKHTWKEFL